MKSILKKPKDNNNSFYKVVETKKQGKTLLFPVPQLWEHNGKLMLPPETDRENAMKKPWDPPGSLDNGWIELNCVLRRTFVPSYSQALEEIRLMSKDSDKTEDRVRKDVSAVKKADSQRANLNDDQDKNTVSLDDISSPSVGSSLFNINCNDYSKYLQHGQNIIQIQNQQKQPLKPGEKPNGHMFVVGTDGKLVVIPIKSEGQHGTGIEGMIVSLVDAVSKLQSRMEYSITLQERILSNMTTGTPLNHVHVTSPDQDSFEPIDSIDQLIAFEENLTKKEFADDLFLKMSSICCPNSGQSGDNVSYRIVDSLFSRKLFTLVSWSGVSRCKQNENFSRFVNAFKFFHSLVRRCDPRYSKTSLKSFFQKIINNSRRRYETSKTNKPKRVSAIKHGGMKRKRTMEPVNCPESSQLVMEIDDYNSNNDDVSLKQEDGSEAEYVDSCNNTESEDDKQPIEFVVPDEQTLDWLKEEYS